MGADSMDVTLPTLCDNGYNIMKYIDILIHYVRWNVVHR